VTLTANVQLCRAAGTAGDKLRLRTWIAIELIGEDDQPIPGMAYRVALPGGTVKEGKLDDKGSIEFMEVPPGTCKVTFPELDQEAWVREEEGEAASGESNAA
jgi:hypothetical protein